MAPLQPLQQTVFEQGPQAATVPTGEPIPVYQEGQVILPEPINPAVALDPGVNWYGLGEQAMKIAQDLTTETWDYLIKTKENSLRDLGDEYQSKLDNAYMRLSKVEAEAQKLGRQPDGSQVQELMRQVQEVQEDWKKKSREIIGVGQKPTFFDPKIDVFTEKPSSMGLKYQELGLVARSTERDINNQAEKLVFQAQLLGIATEQKNRDVQNFRNDNGPSPDGADKVRAGRPFATWENIQKSGMFLTPEGKIITDKEGLPLLIVNEDKSVSLNPDANFYIPEVKDEWRVALIDIAQNVWPDSVVHSNSGAVSKDYAQRFIRELEKDPLSRNPQKVFEMGAVFARLPPTAVDGFANQYKLSAADRAYVGSVATLVRHGSLGSAALKNPLQWLNQRNMQTAGNLLTALRTSGFRGGQREVIGVIEAGTVAPAVNNFVLPVLSSYLGLSAEELEQFPARYAIKEVERGGRIYISDATSEGPTAYLLEDLIERNPQLQYVLTTAMAYMLGNQDQFGTVDDTGKFQFNETKTKEAVKHFTTVLAGGTGAVVSKDSSGIPVSAFNAELAAAVNPVQQATGTKGAASAWMSSQYSAMDANTGFNMMRQMFRPDQQVYGILANSLGAVRTASSGERIASTLPLSEHLRLAVASDPMTWIALNAKRDDETPFLNPQQAEQLTLKEKLRFTRQAMAKMAPAHLWDVETVIEEGDNGFVEAAGGGLPIRIVGIRDNEGNPWVNEVTDDSLVQNPILQVIADRTKMYQDFSYLPRANNGAPLMYIPTSTVQKVGAETLKQDLSKMGSEVSGGMVPYDLTWGDYSVSTTPLEPGVAVDRAIVPDATAEITPFLEQTFLTNPGTPLIQTPQDFVKFLTFNLQGVKDLPKLDPMMQETILYFVKDFEKIETRNSQFFNDPMLTALLRRGQEMGVTTNGQYVGLLLSAISHKIQNKKQPTTQTNNTLQLSPEEKQIVDELGKEMQVTTRRKNAQAQIRKIEEKAKQQNNTDVSIWPKKTDGKAAQEFYSNTATFWTQQATQGMETYREVDRAIPGPLDFSKQWENFQTVAALDRETTKTFLTTAERAATALYMNYYDERPSKLQLGNFLLNLLFKDINPSALPPVKK